MTPKKSILQILSKAKSVFIAAHYHPDGDALGSCLALARVLRAAGKKTVVYNRDATPYNLEFLPDAGTIVRAIPAEPADVAVMLDVAQPKRVSDDFKAALEKGLFRQLICVDHHLHDKPVGDADWIDPRAASTGMIVHELLKGMKVRFDADLANLIFATLTVDTGSFRYSNTTADVFRLAAELVEKGADPWFAAQNLEENNPPERYRLMALCLESLEVALKGRYSSMTLTREALAKAGATEDMAEEFTSIPRSIRGVEVSAFFREIEEGKIKVSLRSKLFADVSALAKQFGGGGHKHAAGCTIAGEMPAARKMIEEAVQKILGGKGP